ncbi:MAG: hypothetical protein IJ211_00150 [Campylobacter sp.]|nr:hypothetical protein [Campylobacter sp.]
MDKVVLNVLRQIRTTQKNATQNAEVTQSHAEATQSNTQKTPNLENYQKALLPLLDNLQVNQGIRALFFAKVANTRQICEYLAKDTDLLKLKINQITEKRNFKNAI